MGRDISTKALIVCAAVAMACAVTHAQQQTAPQPANQPASQQDQYQGTSNPPADDTINAAQAEQQPIPKPPAGVPMQQQPEQAPPPPQYAAQSPDAGMVQTAPSAEPPALATRSSSYDPDGDIVHPAPLPPGTIEEGTHIFAKLMTRLSSAQSEKGDVFRSRVDADVIQGGQVLIPAGSEIDGKVVAASGGRFAGHGTMQLRPETIVLPNGSQYMMVAQVSGTPGERTRVDGEGTINAGSRYKRDGIEYGGGVGAGVVAGAIVGGPVGALAGGLIGAGVITAHLMLDHPQATLEPGAEVMFTLNSRLTMVAAAPMGN